MVAKDYLTAFIISKVAQLEFGTVSACCQDLIPFVQGCKMRFAKDDKFLVHAEVALLCCTGICSPPLQYPPLDAVLDVLVPQTPDVLTECRRLPLISIGEVRCVVVEALFEVICRNPYI